MAIESAMVTATADQIRALSKLLDKAEIEEFRLEATERGLNVACVKGGKIAYVTMNEYGRPVKSGGL